jgi:hypothetical protein
MPITESGCQQTQMGGALKLFTGLVQHDDPFVKTGSQKKFGVWAMSHRWIKHRKIILQAHGNCEAQPKEDKIENYARTPSLSASNA